jgi:low-density lipoprotein receptor-related protein 1 (alpha-2-macroglobulin receptor)
VDTYLDFIERVDYNGMNRKTILRGSPVQNLYSAAVFENTLFVTSWRNNSILAVDKFHPENHSTILGDLKRPFAIRVFHRQRQPVGNFSSEKDHPCMNQTTCDHVR